MKPPQRSEPKSALVDPLPGKCILWLTLCAVPVVAKCARSVHERRARESEKRKKTTSDQHTRLTSSTK